MAELLASPAFLGSLATLTFLEVVLGIDNLLFISIATGKLQGAEKKRATRIGIWGAMGLRILMLSLIFVIIGLDKEALFTLPHDLAMIVAGGEAEAAQHFEEITIKDLILFAGGLFLLWKGTQEIHASVEGTHHEETTAKSTFTSVVVQLFVINIVFSLDSVITAIGMTTLLPVMIAAVVLSTFVMAVAADPLSKFISEHPTTKMLALAFILLVGVALVADGLGFHIPRGYLYFAIAFSLGVELLNIRTRKKADAKAAVH
ncbi:MAG: TerC family protein [Hyphomonas sp.]|uniref:TerC family protein n=1 Tax=Hyphomonas sp. TaxID=87 RepID=UPI0017B93366|nr:TerC family protein [Hyphomonas sp.]MBA3069600.1 TerC family protein [Hyphomonas sp.]MBU3921271.1 TerC family protein [Alphaproteobacteria bacterium]MBU4063239.1 TerC family protein [Alphaproteobacteria bacterium]MBU4164057.1 TerC family protein [Alphaproteobacteria bacterium]